MNSNNLSKSKTICILSVVICCFAILWPKIFLPMFQQAISFGSQQNTKSDSLSSSMVHPRMREAMAQHKQINKEPGRPFHTNGRFDQSPNPQQSKNFGIMGLIMPIYTIGIILFFLYTILKLVFNKNSSEFDENDEDKVILNDFHMDPEHRKFVFNEEYDENGCPIKLSDKENRKKKESKQSQESKDYNDFKKKSSKIKQSKPLNKTEKIINEYGKDKESEINQLEKKIKETERELEDLVKRMSVVSKRLADYGILPAGTYENGQINQTKNEESDNEQNENESEYENDESSDNSCEDNTTEEKELITNSTHTNEENEDDEKFEDTYDFNDRDRLDCNKCEE